MQYIQERLVFKEGIYSRNRDIVIFSRNVDDAINETLIIFNKMLDLETWDIQETDLETQFLQETVALFDATYSRKPIHLTT